MEKGFYAVLDVRQSRPADRAKDFDTLASKAQKAHSAIKKLLQYLDPNARKGADLALALLTAQAGIQNDSDARALHDLACHDGECLWMAREVLERVAAAAARKDARVRKDRPPATKPEDVAFAIPLFECWRLITGAKPGTRWPRWLLTGTSGTNADVWRWIIVAAPVVAGLSIKAAEVPRPWRFLIRAVGTVLAVYGVSTIQPFALDLHASALAGQAYLALPLIGLLCAIFGWWRPSLYVLPVVAVSWYREEFSRCIGFPTANGEELTLQECALFLLVGGIALAIWKRLRPSQSAGIASVFSTLVMNVLYSPLSPKSVPTPSFGISPLMTQSSADGGSKSQARSSGKRI